MGEERQSVLIVADNPMTEGQLKGIFYRRRWETIVCEDGDKAVDEYVEHKPDLVLLSLDIPGLDGHLAALEMRETDYEARIVFVTSRTRLETAEDASFSAGATAVLVTPVTASDVDEKWDAIMGEVPGAPGLADLDELYPEMKPEMPPMPELPPMPEMPELPPAPAVEEPVEPPRKKRRWLRRITLLLALSVAGAGAAHYAGVVDLSEYIDQIRDIAGI